jgi:signal transduction histidine kinase
MKTRNADAGLVIDQALLQQILDVLPVGVWIADTNGLLVANNPAGRNVWAGERWLTPDQYGEYKGWWSSTGKLIQPDEWGMARAVAKGEASHNEMVDIECFDGSRKTILNSSIPLLDSAGKMLAAVTVNQDITELKHSQDRLELAQRQLEALSGKVLAVQEEERKRLSMELHDEVGQTLSALKISIEMIRRRCRNQAIVTHMAEAEEMVNVLLADIRKIAHRLRPPPLDDLGLVAAVRWHLDHIASLTSLNISFEVESQTPRLSSELELCCFRIIQEAVTNTMRHAQANNLVIRLQCSDKYLTLNLQDDGCGFDAAVIYTGQSRYPLGLLGMRERVAMSGGELRVTAAPGAGTGIHAVFPLDDQ